jgi:hypothetical protein
MSFKLCVFFNQIGDLLGAGIAVTTIGEVLAASSTLAQVVSRNPENCARTLAGRSP